ncbi:hypothetical protein, partial [Methylobacterium radiotolerans]|uniref:hypothetical protein n=1 Tax=Methylobacterium radiotolerans TaxID=31998 RepID=UPI001AECA176
MGGGGVGGTLALAVADEQRGELSAGARARLRGRRAEQIRDVVAEGPVAARAAGERIEPVLAGRVSEKD